MKTLFISILFCISCTKQTVISTNSVANLVDNYDKNYNKFQRVNIDSAKVYVDSIFIISKKYNYKKGIGIAMLNFGLLENVKGNFSLAIHNCEKALSIFALLNNDILQATCYSSLGFSYWQKGDNDKAIQYQLKALKINEKLNMQKEIAFSYNSISSVYQSQNKLLLAEEFANKAFVIINKFPPSITGLAVFHNLANIYGMQGKYKEALRLDSIGLRWCDELNIDFNKSMFYDNMANCFSSSNRDEQAIKYHLKAISIDSTFKNNKQLGDTYFNLGYIYEQQKKYDQTIIYYKKSLSLCKETGYKIGVKNALEQLSTTYFKLNKFLDAYIYLKESMIVKDSIINNVSEEKIAELQTLYDTEKKKQEIAQQALKINRRNILLILFATLFLFSLISFYLFYNRRKLQQEKNLQDQRIKEEEKRYEAILESEENERQRLARELHDGVGQLLTATKLNLSMLSNFNDMDASITVQNSLDILDDSIKEIRNISHNMVPDVLLKFGLQRAVIDFIARINQTKKIKIEFECIAFDEKYLNDTSKLMLYRIIQESVNNTIKYAEATQLNIQLSADDAEISLLMEDNGKGFNVSEALQKDGIGLKNMQLRTNYLKGKLLIDSSPKIGTTIIIEIPLT